MEASIQNLHTAILQVCKQLKNIAIYLCSILFIVPCPHMIIPPEPVTVRPNVTVTFSCLAWSYGGLVYKWNKNDSLTLPSNSSIFFQDKSFPADSSCFTTIYELKIVNAQVIDEGWYCCVASNDCGNIRECAWLEVDSKLYIQVFHWYSSSLYVVNYMYVAISYDSKVHIL